MNIKITAELCQRLNQIIDSLSGGARQLFMASLVAGSKRGAAALFERELGWSRVTMRKGLAELAAGQPCEDVLTGRGPQHVPIYANSPVTTLPATSVSR
jgi:hypothetical protein